LTAKGRNLSKPLNVLIVEDNQDDLDLLLRTLQRGGYKVNHLCVDNAQALTDALKVRAWDIVLTDFNMPRFSGTDAISLIRESLVLDVPIIVVSGAIGEETAVRLIKAGAQDYVLKDKLSRLPVAVEREVSAAQSRRERAAFEKQRVLERENFISIVAHDLRAPVQRVETMVQLLRTDYERQFDDEGKDIVFRIERSAARLRLMLASLLAYTRYGRGATKGKIASLPNSIDEVLENLNIDKTNSDLLIALDGIDWIKGDAVLIGHVIQNLVSNAYKFRRKDRRFKISFDARLVEDGKVQVSVADNGIGIEPRFADKVFDIFYRLHDEDEYDGTGIGLAICKKIINDHGGAIWIDRNYFDGTNVIFTLEVADMATATIVPTADTGEQFTENIRAPAPQ
jgi:K+-sensing histidine kinase KdpD